MDSTVYITKMVLAPRVQQCLNIFHMLLTQKITCQYYLAYFKDPIEKLPNNTNEKVCVRALIEQLTCFDLYPLVSRSGSNLEQFCFISAR